MDVKDFYYDLPQELIAQDPLEDRSSSRLMVLDKITGEVEHRHFKDIIEYLRPGDCLVINNTKVIPARLYGVKEGTEAKIEILLLKRKENDIWETLVKPGRCHRTLHISFRIRTVTRQFMPNMTDPLQLRQQGFISHRNCCSRCVTWG